MIEVLGYNYDDLAWGIVDATPEDTAEPKGVSMREAFLKGKQFQWRLIGKAAEHAGTDYFYAAIADLTPQGKRAARAHLKAHPSAAPGVSGKDVIGWARLGCFRERDDDAPYVKVDETRVFLEGLDEGHVLDRMVSAIWAYQARLFGPGPLDPQVQAHKAAQQQAQTEQQVLEAALAAPTGRSRTPRL